MKNPLVTIIVVVRNGERYVKYALESIALQKYDHYEIIVVDGKSTDRTREIASKFSRVRIIIQEKDGLANARNLGIQETKGNFIAFLDHDDLWKPGKLAAQLNSLSSNDEISYSISYGYEFVGEGGIDAILSRSEKKPSPFVAFTPGSMLTYKSVFETVGNFNEKLKIACDSEWFARTRTQEVKWAVVPYPFFLKRRHDQNISLKKQIYRMEMLDLIVDRIRKKKQRI